MMRHGPYRLWGLAFAAFLCMIAAWVFAAPYDASADERDHVYRAVGVVSGEVTPTPAKAVRESGAFQTVPKGLARDPQDVCLLFMVEKPATCAKPPTADRTPVVVASGAGRYHPVYYAVVGGPLKLWPGWPGVFLSRLISAAICAALLAGAVVCIARYAPGGAVMAGLLVATTPTGMHYFAAVNPNGPEIAAAIAFFAAAIPLATGRWAGQRSDRSDEGRQRLPGPAARASAVEQPRAAGVPRALVALVGISALWLAMLRPTGLMFLAVAAVAFLLPLDRTLLASLWASRPARWWAGGLLFAAVTSVIWLVVMKGGDAGTTFQPRTPYRAGQAVINVVGSWRDWIEQAIGLFAWISVRIPPSSYLIWECAAGFLVVFALVTAGRIDRWRMFVLFCGAVVIPTAIQIYFLNSVGWVTQGRYMLPGLAGLVLMAAYIVDGRALSPAHGRTLVRLFALALLPIHVLSLVWTMVRWQKGIPGGNGMGIRYLNPFSGEWHPVVGSATPVILMLVGVLGVAWLAVRSGAAEPTAGSDGPPMDQVATGPGPSRDEPSTAGYTPSSVTPS